MLPENTSPYPALPETVVRAGMDYAREKRGITLDQDKLVFFYNLARDRRRLLRSQMKQLEQIERQSGRRARRGPDGANDSFRAACGWVLDKHLMQRNHDEQLLYQGYLRALAKMGNAFRQLMNPAAKAPEHVSELERIKQYVGINSGDRQYHLILPSGR